MKHEMKTQIKTQNITQNKSFNTILPICFGKFTSEKSKCFRCLWVDGEEFVDILSRLTGCEIEYNIFVKPETFIKISERWNLRIYEVSDRLYCNESKYIVYAKVSDLYDNEKSKALIIEYRVLNIEEVKYQ
jgi:hypothetical protein